MSGPLCSPRASPCGLPRRAVGLLMKQGEETASSLKAGARKCPSVTSAIFYWSSGHRAFDGRNDKGFGAIFNLPKVAY